MDLGLYQVWYVIAGFLMGNGVPHFVFGRAGKVFRSPFGQRSSPRTNVSWGIANFVLATVSVGLLALLDLFSRVSLGFLLLGFWLAMLLFGFRIGRFLND